MLVRIFFLKLFQTSLSLAFSTNQSLVFKNTSIWGRKLSELEACISFILNFGVCLYLQTQSLSNFLFSLPSFSVLNFTFVALPWAKSCISPFFSYFWLPFAAQVCFCYTPYVYYSGSLHFLFLSYNIPGPGHN